MKNSINVLSAAIAILTMTLTGCSGKTETGESAANAPADSLL